MGASTLTPSASLQLVMVIDGFGYDVTAFVSYRGWGALSQTFTRKMRRSGSISIPVLVTLPKSGKDQSDDSTGNCVHSKLRLCSHWTPT